jgi:hypothetical protein
MLQEYLYLIIFYLKILDPLKNDMRGALLKSTASTSITFTIS